MKDIYAGLNEAQRRAVDHREGPAIVLAGPGAGKTKTLTTRAAALVQEGVPPESILLLTFTRASAQAMLKRASALDVRCEFISGGTFHSVTTKAVNANFAIFGAEKAFTVLDADDAKEAVKKCMAPIKGTEKNWPRASTISKVLSYAVNAGISIEDAILAKARQQIDFLGEIKAIQEAYTIWKLDRHLIDYDDALVYFIELLRDPDVGPQLRNRWRYIMVDEYQDTNELQLQLISGLAGSDPNPNILIVGDPCQPEDTMISRIVKSGRGTGRTIADREIENVPISELQIGDKIVGYDVASSAFFLNRTVEGITARPYTDELVVTKLPDGRRSRYTVNHHCLANFKSLENKIALYLMRKGDRFRIGRAKMAYDAARQPGQKSVNGSGPIRRAKVEKADDLWILDTFDNHQDAAVAEFTTQAKFGLSGLTFVSSKNCTNKQLLDEQHLEKCWTQLESLDLLDRAQRCLTHFNRRIDYPIWTSTNPGNTSFKRPAVYHACNILDGALMLPFDADARTHVRRGRWVPATVTRESYSGLVYSLTVSHDKLYVADGIVTKNCQSIYGFRGSAPATMSRFRDTYPTSNVISLEINYRSTPEIVAVVNAIDKAMHLPFDRTLVSGRQSIGERPVIVHVADAQMEAKAICKSILEDKAAGGEVENHAILVRSMSSARRIETEMITQKIPYRVMGGIRIDEAAHIKDLLSIARLRGNIMHEPAWLRLLGRFNRIGEVAAANITDKMMLCGSLDEAIEVLEDEGVARKSNLAVLADGLRAVTSEHLPADALAATVKAMTPLWSEIWKDDYETRVRDLDAIILIAEEYDDMETFLVTITLDASMGRESQGNERREDEKPVTISTIHSAKGLEWKHVHVPSFTYGSMPAIYDDGEDGRDEELRVFYVAASRAERHLRLYRPRMSLAGNLTSASPFEELVSRLMSVENVVEKRQPLPTEPIVSNSRIDMRARLLARQ